MKINGNILTATLKADTDKRRNIPTGKIDLKIVREKSNKYSVYDGEELLNNKAPICAKVAVRVLIQQERPAISLYLKDGREKKIDGLCRELFK